MPGRKSAHLDSASFGGWLQSMRDELGLPQWRVGAEIGVDAATYAKFEAQKRWPQPERLMKLAKLFGRPLKQMQARMAVAKAVADCGGDFQSIAEAVQETQADYGPVNNLSATGATARNKKK